MATQPLPPGGGLTLTGDPQLESELGAQGPAPGAFAPEDALNPVASVWSTYWQSQRDQSIRPPWLQYPTPQPAGPGTPGYGVLKDGKKARSLSGEKPDFFINDQADRARGVDAQYDNDRSRLQALADRYYGRPATPAEVADLWMKGILDVDAAETIGADPMDPWHWLDQRVAQEEALRAEAEEKSGPRTETQVQRTINLTDPTTANAAIDMTLRNLLGRRADDHEREEFLSTLRSTEEANPTVTTETRQYDGVQGEATEVSATTTGGAPDAGTFAQSWTDEELLGEQKAMLAASYYDILRGL